MSVSVSVRVRTCGELGELGEHVQCDGARLELRRGRRARARARLQQQVPLRAAQVHAAGLCSASERELRQMC